MKFFIICDKFFKAREKEETAEFSQVVTLIISTFLLSMFHLAWTNFFLSIWERIHYPIPGAWFMYRLSRPKFGMFQLFQSNFGMFRLFRPNVGMSRLSRPNNKLFDFVRPSSDMCWLYRQKFNFFRLSRPTFLKILFVRPAEIFFDILDQASICFDCLNFHNRHFSKVWRHVCTTPHEYVSTFLTKNRLLINVSRVWKCLFSSFSLKIFT